MDHYKEIDGYFVMGKKLECDGTLVLGMENEHTTINREEAIEIINHLKEVFRIP